MDQLLKTDKPNALELRCASLQQDKPAKFKGATVTAVDGQPIVTTEPIGVVRFPARNYTANDDYNMIFENPHIQPNGDSFVSVSAYGTSSKLIATAGQDGTPNVVLGIRNVTGSDADLSASGFIEVNFVIVQR